jgi:hypothetical protein
MYRKQTILPVLMILLFGSIAMAQSNHWIHVMVEEGGDNGESVKVNIPASLIETVLPMIEDNDFITDKIRLDELPLTVEQMREIWQTVQSEGDFELASIRDDDMDLRIYKKDDYLYVRSSEAADQKVSVTIPAQVVDLLLSGEGDELNVMAAAKALTQTHVGELVEVRDGDETVRVWIDTRSSLE